MSRAPPTCTHKAQSLLLQEIQTNFHVRFQGKISCFLRFPLQRVAKQFNNDKNLHKNVLKLANKYDKLALSRRLISPLLCLSRTVYANCSRVVCCNIGILLYLYSLNSRSVVVISVAFLRFAVWRHFTSRKFFLP